MGGALIDLVRGRYGPSRVSSAWALASSATGAERFAREVSLRWERAAAELEELIRARIKAPEHEETVEMSETAPPATARATLDRNVVSRARKADFPRTDASRRTHSSPDRQDAGERRMPLEPSRMLGQGREEWTASAEIAEAHPRNRRGEGAPARDPEPGPLPREEPGHPMPIEPHRRFELEARGPSRGSPAVRPGEAPWRWAAPGPGGRPVFELDPRIAVPRAPLEEPDVPRRDGGLAPRAGASARAAAPGFPGHEESPRYRRRDGGPAAPAAASGRTPRRAASPGPPLDLLVEEARRRAEALEDWERTGF